MESKDTSKKDEEDIETKINKIIDTFEKSRLGKENSKKYKDR